MPWIQTSLLQATGTLGLIATNTVAQGDTREVGLDAMVASQFTITRAIQSRPWPASSANLEYAAVWGTTGPVPDSVPRISDDQPVKGISTLLEPAGRIAGLPVQLEQNARRAFIGSIVNGIGFTMPTQVAKDMISHDVRNREVLFPYLTGEDANSNPDAGASRWVVDFTGHTETSAATFALPFVWVESNVKEYRQTLINKPRQQAEWWLFERPGPALRRAISQLSDVLVIALVSKTVVPMRVPADQVFSHKLGVFATDSPSDLALLSSSLHWLWTVKYTSTMRADINYSPSDVFSTFPRPNETPALKEVGRRLDRERREIMLRRKLGVTKLYNLINDPRIPHAADRDVARLRDIHVEIDAASLDAYGWGDIQACHGFQTYRQLTRWSVDPPTQVEVLDRLLEENQSRTRSALDRKRLAADDSA